MQTKQKYEHTKQLYKKPQLRIIELEAEEVLATGCKTAGVAVAFGEPSCGIGVPCSVDGS